ncbi:hypothetical protein IP84_16110 [beta proteobacterium AAP99]|nr:hypothetical protein IP84_16110 [beta proteobacterium AAP99]
MTWITPLLARTSVSTMSLVRLRASVIVRVLPLAATRKVWPWRVVIGVFSGYRAPSQRIARATSRVFRYPLSRGGVCRRSAWHERGELLL